MAHHCVLNDDIVIQYQRRPYSSCLKRDAFDFISKWIYIDRGTVVASRQWTNPFPTCHALRARCTRVPKWEVRRKYECTSERGVRQQLHGWSVNGAAVTARRWHNTILNGFWSKNKIHTTNRSRRQAVAMTTADDNDTAHHVNIIHKTNSNTIESTAAASERIRIDSNFVIFFPVSSLALSSVPNRGSNSNSWVVYFIIIFGVPLSADSRS